MLRVIIWPSCYQVHIYIHMTLIRIIQHSYTTVCYSPLIHQLLQVVTLLYISGMSADKLLRPWMMKDSIFLTQQKTPAVVRWAWVCVIAAWHAISYATDTQVHAQVFACVTRLLWFAWNQWTKIQERKENTGFAEVTVPVSLVLEKWMGN